MKKIVKQAKGITLIALVITIVILLILTGITLKLSIGDNSILARATQASKDTKKAQVKEQMGLDFGESQIELNEDANKSYEEVITGMIDKIKDEGVVGFNDIREKNSEDYNFNHRMTILLNAKIEKNNKYYNSEVTIDTHFNYEENSNGPIIDNIEYGDLTEIDSIDYADKILFEYLMARTQNEDFSSDYETDTAKLIYTYIAPRYKAVLNMSHLGSIEVEENSIFLNKIDNCYYELVDFFTEEWNQTFMKKVNLAPMTIRVNSGDDKNVSMNLGVFKGTIDWGDGQKEQVDHLVSTNFYEEGCLPSNKIASVDGKFKMAETDNSNAPYIAEHTYDEANKEYEIVINGLCPELAISDSGDYSSEVDNTVNEFEKVTCVEDWGSLGSIFTSFEGCQNLASIPEPTEETFKFALSAQGMFADCKSLSSIPENLFKWNKYTVDYSGTFVMCQGLTSIPAGIFDENINTIEYLRYTFAACTNLTGEAPKLWEHVRAGNNSGRMDAVAYRPYNDEYASKFPDGCSCFGDDTNLSNYDEIPQYWKYVPQPE